MPRMPKVFGISVIAFNKATTSIASLFAKEFGCCSKVTI